MTLPILMLRPPYDFPRSIRFWRRSTGELCEQWADGVYRRFVELDGQRRLLSLENAGSLEAPAVAVALDGRAANAQELAALEPAVRTLLGDDLDLNAFYAAIGDEPPLAALAERLRGLKAPRTPPWEALVWTICGQQISLPFAYTLKQRLVARYGAGFDVAGRTLFAFPHAETLATADVGELRSMQFSMNKARFITGLAQAIVAGDLNLERLAALPTPDAIATLTRFPGVGPWTAEFLLMRGLGRADALPANDAGVRQGVALLYGQRLPEPQLRAFAARWGGWQGVVALYLLAALRADE